MKTTYIVRQFPNWAASDTVAKCFKVNKALKRSKGFNLTCVETPDGKFLMDDMGTISVKKGSKIKFSVEI